MQASGVICQTPVLLLIRNRPQLTSRVLEGIRRVRPVQLLVAADGPEDEQLCQETRRIVLKSIDWPCSISMRFSAIRLGCKKAVSEALNWAFELHEELIVLEDDCVPNLSFFLFCEQMLARYRTSPDVMQICGSNLTGFIPGESSYYFSRFGPIWGWASWRRAWQTYDVNMACWPHVREKAQLGGGCPEPFEAQWRRRVFDEVYTGLVDTWDYQWAFAKMIRKGLSIVPARNLISNIGFGVDATHTTDTRDPRSELPTNELSWPLVHPSSVDSSLQADRMYLQSVVGLPSMSLSIAALRQWVRLYLR